MTDKEFLQMVRNSFAQVRNKGNLPTGPELIESLLSVQPMTDELVAEGYTNELIKLGSSNLQRKKVIITAYMDINYRFEILDIQKQEIK